jgi:hypothetical protein
MISAHIEIGDAIAFLVKRGWQVEMLDTSVKGTPRQSALVLPGQRRRADGGVFGEDYLWDLSEAVTTEIEAIAND